MSSRSLSVDIRASSLKASALVKSSFYVRFSKNDQINQSTGNDDHNEFQRQHLKENDALFLHLDCQTYGH